MDFVPAPFCAPSHIVRAREKKHFNMKDYTANDRVEPPSTKPYINTRPLNADGDKKNKKEMKPHENEREIFCFFTCTTRDDAQHNVRELQQELLSHY